MIMMMMISILTLTLTPFYAAISPIPIYQYQYHTIPLYQTIRLPIDLSCISDRTINRLAALTHPKTLAHTKDRKDKILNKLYKRRVELDFSRKSGSRGGVRWAFPLVDFITYLSLYLLNECTNPNPNLHSIPMPL